LIVFAFRKYNNFEMAQLPNEPQVPLPKEQKDVVSRLFPEKHPVVERPTTPEVPPEIEHVEAVPGAEIQLPQPVTDDATGQVLVTSPAATQPKIILPLTEEEVERGLHLKVIHSFRWLAEWCRRLIKVFHGRVVYRQTKE
jgi:hypothetical protein